MATLDDFADTPLPNLLHDLLSDPETKQDAMHAAIRLLINLKAARIQQRRIWDQHAETGAPAIIDITGENSQILMDIHYYFICWAMIHKMVGHLLKAIPAPKAKDVWKSLEPQIRRFRDGRNELEHLVERLPGGENVRGVFMPWNLGRLTAHYFEFNDDTWNISRARFEVLTDSIEELVMGIREFMLERYRTEHEIGTD